MTTRDRLYEGCVVRVIKGTPSWGWWYNHVGEELTVIKIREDYDDVIVVGGNSIDISDIEFVR